MGIHLLNAAARHDLKRFMAIGSACAYAGDVAGDMKEQQFWAGPLHPSVEAYGFTKKVLQVGLNAYSKQYGIAGQLPLITNLYGEHDVFGDGSVVCLPTHGHTPGHQSLKLHLPGGDVVLAADSCYFCRTLRERRLPRFAYDKEAMLVALDRLAALETAGARIFFGHDPEFWQTVPQAPTAIT